MAICVFQRKPRGLVGGGGFRPGVGVRTPFGLPGIVKVMDNDVLPALPRLPTMVLQQHCKSQQASVLQLKGLLEQEILEHLKMH